MGTWGWKIFQNDTACDIKDDYREKLIMGYSDEDAEAFIVAEFMLESERGNWIPLAVTEWKLGRLSPRAKEQALAAIDAELQNLAEFWKAEHIPKREQELLFAKEQLCSEMPKPKRLRVPWYAYKCPWKVGSVIQYKMRYAAGTPAEDCYILLLIRGISETPPDKMPIDCIAVNVYDWFDKTAPCEQIDSIISAPPKLAGFKTLSGAPKHFHSLMLSKEIIKEHKIELINETPLPGSTYTLTNPTAPMNASFEKFVIWALLGSFPNI